MAQGPLPSSVLFVCGMNAIRSPMAEHLVRRHFGDRVFVQSAGVNAGDPDPFMVAAMAELDIDTSTHQPTTLEDLDDSYYDLIITLAPEAHHRTLEFTRDQAADVEYWATMDPSTVAGNREQVLQAYRETRDRLEKTILARFGTPGT